MNVRIFCACALLLSGLAQAQTAQPGLGGYSSMEIDAGRMKGNFATGAINEMTEGVKIRLLSEDPSLEPLPIKAQSMKFTWKEGASTPSIILMEKNVEVNHPDASITADRAEWNFDSGELVFTGDPVVNNEKIKGLRGDKMILNLKTNTFEVARVRADQVPLQGVEGGGKSADPSMLAENDIKDWSALLTTLRGEAKTDGASPGKQVLSQISPDNRQLLTSVDMTVLLQRKGDIVKLVNSVLKSPKLYDSGAWQGKTLTEEAQQLIANEKRTPQEQSRLNRLLLCAAYPELIAAP